jgi:hypothetical protein
MGAYAYVDVGYRRERAGVWAGAGADVNTKAKARV